MIGQNGIWSSENCLSDHHDWHSNFLINNPDYYISLIFLYTNFLYVLILLSLLPLMHSRKILEWPFPSITLDFNHAQIRWYTMLCYFIKIKKTSCLENVKVMANQNEWWKIRDCFLMQEYLQKQKGLHENKTTTY